MNQLICRGVLACWIILFKIYFFFRILFVNVTVWILTFLTWNNIIDLYYVFLYFDLDSSNFDLMKTLFRFMLSYFLFFGKVYFFGKVMLSYFQCIKLIRFGFELFMSYSQVSEGCVLLFMRCPLLLITLDYHQCIWYYFS